MKKIVSLVAIVVLLSTPALAQSVVSASNAALTWTGKQGDVATYTWSSSVSNPSKRAVTAIVTLQLIDAAGTVVAADTKTVVLQRESKVDVGGESSLPHADARRATQYRIMVEGAES